MVLPNILQSSFSRIWIIRYGAGPNNPPELEGLARAGEPSFPLGDLSPIFIPDADRYGQFIVAGKVQGERGLPNMDVVFRYKTDAKGALTRFVRDRCDHDVQVHMGLCEDPNAFNEGWTKILVLAKARPANEYTLGQLGALGPSEDAMVDETVPFVAEDMYEILRMQFAEQALTQIVQEIVDVVVCDAVSCGQCGLPTGGCDIVFSLTLTAGGSPGLPAEIIFTRDGGTVYGETNISTLAANEDPNRMACIGSNLVVVSEDSESLHYADISDILDGTETWTEVSTGFVVTNGPLAIAAISQANVWIVAENGYIYFASDITSGVVVQDAGVATTQDLNDVSAFDKLNVVAVGASNAVVITRNGGDTWASILGPNVGVVLNAVWFKGVNEIWIGDAGGQLWYTINGGTTWNEKVFPGSGAGVVRDIKFVNDSVGYLAHDTAAPAGGILRTIDGGNSWYLLPEGIGSIPANDRINAVAPCSPNDPNTVFGGGLADDAVDGILVKGS